MHENACFAVYGWDALDMKFSTGGLILDFGLISRDEAALSRADRSTHTFSIKESKKHAEIICRSSESNLTMEVASRMDLELLHLPYFCIAVLSS